MIYSRDGMNRRYTQNAQFNLSNLSPYTNEMISNKQAATSSNVSSGVKLSYDDYRGMNIKMSPYINTNESIGKSYAPQYVTSDTAQRNGSYYKTRENYTPVSVNYNITRDNNIRQSQESKIPENNDVYLNHSISSYTVHNQSRHISKNSDINATINQNENIQNNGQKETNNKNLNAMNLNLNKLEKNNINITNDLYKLNDINNVTRTHIKNNRKNVENSAKSGSLKNIQSWKNSNGLRNSKKKNSGKMINGTETGKETGTETRTITGTITSRNGINDEIERKQNKTNIPVVHHNTFHEIRSDNVITSNGMNKAGHRVVIKVNDNLEKTKTFENPIKNDVNIRHIRIYEENNNSGLDKENGKETIRSYREETEKHIKNDNIKKEENTHEKSIHKISESTFDKINETNTSEEIEAKGNIENKLSISQEKKKINNKKSTFVNIKGNLPYVVPSNINDEIINNEGALEIFQNIVIIDKYNGLKEWNGYEWKKIESTYTFFIKARYDNKGNLWCINDLYEILKLTNGKFQSFGLLGNEEIVDLGFDKKNVLWCINRKGDLLKWSKMKWKKISFSGFHKLSSIAFDKTGNLWGINSKRSIAVWNVKDKRWEEKKIENNVKIACIDFDDNNMLWTVTTSGALLSYCSGNWLNCGLICRNKLISVSFRRA